MRIVRAAPANEPGATFLLWPENELAFALWFAAQTCLHRDLRGVVGIDYPRLERMLQLTHCPRLPRSPRRRAELWAALRAVELAVLVEWNPARQRAQR